MKLMYDQTIMQLNNETIPDCIFCKIAAGTIPCQKVWEDENYLAFLDIKPLAEGHTLLIPKKHFRWVWDLPAGKTGLPAGRQVSPNYSEYMEKAKEVALLLKGKYQADWIEMKVMGIDVPHAHIHLIPYKM